MWCSWSMAFEWVRSRGLQTRSPPVTQDFIDHARGSLEMILSKSVAVRRRA
jgi:hypothetical protein